MGAVAELTPRVHTASMLSIRNVVGLTSAKAKLMCVYQSNEMSSVVMAESLGQNLRFLSRARSRLGPAIVLHRAAEPGFRAADV